MKHFLNRFNHQLILQPQAIAITDAHQAISYSKLGQEIEKLRLHLQQQNINCLAIAMINSPAYIAADLATVFDKITSIPVPHFFSASQRMHMFNDAGVDAVIMDQGFDTSGCFSEDQVEFSMAIHIFGKTYTLTKLKVAQTEKCFSTDTLKISYTSGTTGHPKGVLISASQVDRVVHSLSSSLKASPQDRHISILPFSLLLENIAGIYTVLASGGNCIVPQFSEFGLNGSSSLDAEKFLNTLRYYQPTTMITVPAFAQALVAITELTGNVIPSLRYIAVGGAPISASVIIKAQTLGLPLFQGYGLTECSSVVAINSPDQNRTGSVGKPLEHIRIEISEENEIYISGAVCEGYINHPEEKNPSFWATGDLGYLDNDGYLFVTGRKRTTYCTAYGRNISPEWIESELVSHPQIDQALIYGEGKPFNLAIIVAHKLLDDTQLDIVIADINKQLPDYAQIACWLRASEPYSCDNRQLSSSGAIQRSQIISDYEAEILEIYQ